MRESFIFYDSFLTAIDELDSETKLKVYEAITHYALKNEEPNLTGIAKAIFSLIKPQIDANNKRYENGKKGAGFGKLGGRPKKKKPQENPKETPNVNENVNVNVNVNENENVNAIGFLCEENFLEPKTKIDPFTNPLIDDCFSLYKENCPNLLKLGFEPRNRQLREELTLFLQEIDCDIGYFKELCENANKLRLIANKPIDFKSMIRNHIGITNGKYVSETDFKIEELDFS